MKKLSCILLALVMLFSLAACTGNGKSENPAVGTWNGLYTKFVGDSEKDESDSFKLVLTADGKGTHYRDGTDFNVKWKLNGEDFTMTETFILELDYTGTLKDGELHIFNGDPNDIWTCEYVYTKEGYEPGSSASGGGTENSASAGGETYDTGLFKVTAPKGWKVFPQHDVFSDDPDVMNPNYLTICKGGSSDLDLLSKPTVSINYGGPRTTLLSPSRDYYENVEDVPDLTTGSYTWEGFYGESYGYKYLFLYEEYDSVEFLVTINYDTTGGKISPDDADVQALLASIEITDPEYTGVSSGGSASGAANVDPDSPAGRFGGDWHGMVAFRDCSGAYEGAEGQETTALARFVFDEYDNMQTFIGVHVENAPLEYLYTWQDGKQMYVSGYFLDEYFDDMPVTEENGTLHIEIGIDGEDGAVTLVFNLRRVGDEGWTDEDPKLSQEIVDTVRGMDFDELAALNGFSPSDYSFGE